MCCYNWIKPTPSFLTEERSSSSPRTEQSVSAVRENRIACQKADLKATICAEPPADIIISDWSLKALNSGWYQNIQGLPAEDIELIDRKIELKHPALLRIIMKPVSMCFKEIVGCQLDKSARWRELNKIDTTLVSVCQV